MYTTDNTKTKKLFRWKNKTTNGGECMARKQQNDDLLIDDELTAAFLGDDQSVTADDNSTNDDWNEEESIPGQLAVDVYETREKVFVIAPIAGVNKGDLDVSISDNTLTIQGTRSVNTDGAENFYLQESYWGDFSRSITMPVPVKEDEIDAVLKDGVLTISFTKVKQDTIKKIEIK